MGGGELVPELGVSGEGAEMELTVRLGSGKGSLAWASDGEGERWRDRCRVHYGEVVQGCVARGGGARARATSLVSKNYF